MPGPVAGVGPVGVAGAVLSTTVVREMLAGTFSWDEEDAHYGDYTVEWLPEESALETRSRLRIGAEDF